MSLFVGAVSLHPIQQRYELNLFVRVFHDVICVDLTPIVVQLDIVYLPQVVLGARFKEFYEAVTQQDIHSVFFG